MLNTNKCQAMLFNYTRKYQFNTRLTIENNDISIVDQVKLLGVIITSNLSWNKNTSYLVKKAYARMRLLHKLAEFNVPATDSILIYILYIRSICEQSCSVWYSSLTQENSDDLERVQKVALKVFFLKWIYFFWKLIKSVKLTYLETLSIRREELCSNFSKKCLKNDQMKGLFTENKIGIKSRFPEKYHVILANTERFRKSSIVYLQRLLKKSKI